jgi:hypothetical protein
VSPMKRPMRNSRGSTRSSPISGSHRSRTNSSETTTRGTRWSTACG